MGEQSAGRLRRVRRFLVEGDGVQDRHWHCLAPSAPPLSFAPHSCTAIDIGHPPFAGIKPTVRLFAETAKPIFPSTAAASNPNPSSVTNNRLANTGPAPLAKSEPIATPTLSSPTAKVTRTPVIDSQVPTSRPTVNTPTDDDPRSRSSAPDIESAAQGAHKATPNPTIASEPDARVASNATPTSIPTNADVEMSPEFPISNPNSGSKGSTQENASRSSAPPLVASSSALGASQTHQPAHVPDTSPATKLPSDSPPNPRPVSTPPAPSHTRKDVPDTAPKDRMISSPTPLKDREKRQSQKPTSGPTFQEGSNEGSSVRSQSKRIDASSAHAENVELKATGSADLARGWSTDRETLSKRVSEKDTQLEKSTGHVNDPKSLKASKNAVKTSKLPSPGVTKPAPGLQHNQQENISDPLRNHPERGDSSKMMQIVHPEPEPTDIPLSTSEDAVRRKSHSRTGEEAENRRLDADPNPNFTPSGSKTKSSKVIASPSNGGSKTKTHVEERNHVSAGDENSTGKTVTPTDDSTVTHDRDKYLGCVKVLARMLRRHNKNHHDRSKENGRKISIIESRNNLLKAVVDKLQNMDTSLNNGVHLDTPERSAPRVFNRGPVVGSAEGRGQIVTDRRARTPRQPAIDGANEKALTQAPTAGPTTSRPGGLAERFRREPPAQPVELDIVRNLEERLKIVQESRFGVRELGSYFQKLAKHPTSISLSNVRQTLTKFSKGHLQEMRKLGSNAPEYTEKELARFLDHTEHACTLLGFLWDQLKSMFTEFESIGPSSNTDIDKKEKLINQMKKCIVCIREPIRWTSLLSSWVAFKWRTVLEELGNDKATMKDKETSLYYQKRLSDFFAPERVKGEKPPIHFLGQLQEISIGLQNRCGEQGLPLKEERQNLLEILKECLDTLNDAGLEAWTYESDRKSLQAKKLADMKQSTNQAKTSMPRDVEDRRSSLKRKASVDNPGSSEEHGAQPSKRRAMSGSSSGAQRPEVAPGSPARADDARSREGTGSNPSRFVRTAARRPVGEAGNSGHNALGKEQKRQDKDSSNRNAVQDHQSEHVPGKPGESGKQPRKAKRTVNWSDELVSGSCESKLNKPEVQTLFNDGYDLLGEESHVQQQAVEERASQMQRGAVIALYGYLRSYVEMLTKDVEGQPRENPDWVTLPYTPSAVRRMVREREAGKD